MQTLSILIQNVQNQQTEYYLFSNNHLNNIASLRFNFEDDEVLGYYINLLKTISLKLNETTVQFFFRCEPDNPRSGPCFPLYSEAIKFVGHRDTMVRAAVKTLTLNVFGISVPCLRSFLCSPPAAQVFHHVASFGAQKCHDLQSAYTNYVGDTRKLSAAMESCLAEIEDVAAYCNDVLALNVQDITSVFMVEMWSHLIWPLLLKPQTSGADEKHELAESLCSLYASERFLQVTTEPRLASLLVMCLFGGSQEEASRLLNSLVRSYDPDGCCLQRGDADSEMPMLCCQSLLSLLRQNSVVNLQDSRITAGLVRLVSAVLNHKTLPDSVRASVGLLPRLRQRQLELVHKLTTDGDASDTGPAVLPESMDSQETMQPTGTDNLDEIVTFLFGALSLEFLPFSVLAELGWMLNHLLHLGSGSASMEKHWKKLLLSSVEKRKKSVLKMIKIGPWADAVLPLLKKSWLSTASANTLSRSSYSGTLHEAVSTCMESFMLRDLLWQLGEDMDSVIVADFKVAAKMAILTCASFALVAHTANYLYNSSPATWPSQMSEYDAQTRASDIIRSDIHTGENSGVDVSTLEVVAHCDVSFAKGEQRRVLLTIHETSPFPELNIIGMESDSDPSRGTILSVAPLLSCDPAVDQQNSRWLHTRVRPSLSSFLQNVDKTSSNEATQFAIIDSSLTEGHWVLACTSGKNTAADAALRLTDVERKVRHQLYCVAEAAFNDLIEQLRVSS